MKTTIQLSGIVRNIPGNAVPDGTLHEKINLRTTDGVLRPVGDKTILRPEHIQDAIFVHVVDNTENLISYNKDSGIISLYQFEGSDTTLLDIGTGKNISFSHMGKILIVSNNTDKVFRYLSYNVDTTTYDFISNIFPPVLALVFTPNIIHSTSQYGQDKYQTFTNRVPSDTRIITEAPIDGLLNPLKNEWRENGKALGFMIVQYAWKMIDGTYLRHSKPMVLYMGLVPSWLYGEESGSDFWYQVADLAPAKLQLYITRNTYNNTILNSLDNYKNTIESLCIFISKPYDYVIYHPITDDAGNLIDPYFDLKDPDFDDDKWTATQPLYLIKAYKISELQLLSTNAYIDIPMGDLNNITTNEVLDIDNYTHHSVFGEAIYNYNSRFILGNILTTLGDPMIDDYKYNNGSSLIYEMMIEVELSTADGTKIVRSDVYSHPVDSVGLNIWMPKMVSYPDSRATYYRVLAKLPTDSTWLKQLEIALSNSEIANFAYGFIPNVFPSDGSDGLSDTYLVNKSSNNFITLSLYVTGMEEDTNVVDNIVTDTNRLQASLVSNPYVFPAANSYQVGSSGIMAIETNTEPISAGQYGQYPLMVFTQNGIYALGMGSGEVFIQSISPLNGEILLDKQSLINTGDGIIFISSDYSIRVLSGKGADSISDSLNVQEGDFETTTYDIYNPLAANTQYQFFISDERLSTANNYVDVVPFYQYVKKALLVWDNHNNRKELIVTNSSYNYSFVFSFTTKSWGKVSGAYKAVTRNYPYFYGIDKNNVLVNISSEYYPYTTLDSTRVYTKKEIFILSRPIKFGEEIFKKIKRLLLHGYIEVDSGSYFSVYLFGSMDGQSWHYLCGKQQNGTFSNVVLSSEMVSLKYYQLVITGKVSKDSYISYLETEIIQKYTGKLR
jgi:hypothetical protein